MAIGFTVAVATLIGGLATTTPVPVDAAGPIAQLPSDNPANFTPNVLNGEVDSIWQVGSRVIIGGTFTSVANASQNGGATYSRSRIAAFDATTGVVDTAFAPVFNGNVSTVLPAADGTSVYVAGNFTTVNGVTRNRVARINLNNGSLVTTFNAGTVNGNVRDMRLAGDQLYIGGAFTVAGGQQRSRLASLNPSTGAVTSKVNIAFAGTQNGGTTQVFKMDVTPAGDRLFVIGNFAQVGGLDRRQVAMINLSTTPATVHAWQTTFYTSTCAGAFDSYLRDADISEDGSFLVVTTTGAYRANSSCDTIARFPVYVDQAGITPTWVTYTGGDTSYAVEIHNGVAYVGGHQRWMNNPFAADRAGAGAIPREGMAALDVLNGMPYSWNPGRERGVGLFDYHVTSAGIWAGSDTQRWAGELRQRLAFFPWAGGTSVPESLIPALPGEVWLLGRTSGSTAQQDEVQHRSYSGTGAPGANTVSAGTEQWRNVRASFMVNDTLYTLLSNGTFQRRTFNGTFATPATVNIFANNIIADAPNISGMFFDPSDSRIYYTMTGNSSLFYRYFTPESHAIGAQRFSATGAIAALNPSRVRGMFLSDGQIWFADNGNGNLLRIGFAGGAVSGTATVVNNTVDWRGRAMFLDGDAVAPPVNNPPTASFTSSCTLLSCTFTSTSTDSDGTITGHVWNFGDGGTANTASVTRAYAASGTYTVSLLVTDDDNATDDASATVTVSNNTSGVAFRASASGTGGNTNASAVVPGAVQPGDQLLMFVTANVATTATTPAGWTLLGTQQDGSPDIRSWVFTRTAVAGTAGSTAASTLGAAAKSSTLIVAYSNAGAPSVLASAVQAGSSASLGSPAVAVAANGSIVVSHWSDKSSTGTGWTLPGSVNSRINSVGSGSGRITAAIGDSAAPAGTWAGVTATRSPAGTKAIAWSVVVPPAGSPPPPPPPTNSPPTAQFTSSCTALSCTFTSTSTDSDGTITGHAWDLGNGVTASTPTAARTFPAAGTYPVTLVVVDDDGASDDITQNVTVSTGAAVIGFRASSGANSAGANASVTVPAQVQPGDQLLLFVTANVATTATTPDGWTLLGTQQDGSPDVGSWVFTRTAIAGTAGSTVSATLGDATAKSSRLLVAYSGAGAPSVVASSVMAGSSTDLASPAVAVAASGSIVVSHWSDKSSGSTGWTVPASVTGRASNVGSGSGRITAAVGDSAASPGTWPGVTASTSAAVGKAIAWSVVVPPA